MFIAVIIFILGYALIALEAPLKVHKSATALLLAAAIWVFYIFVGEGIFSYTGFIEHFDFYKANHPNGTFLDYVSHNQMLISVGEIAQVLFYLLGAMTIVETIDHFNGFSLLTEKIFTHNKRKLLWILTIMTFLLSMVLDNLTTAIVMCAMMRKLIPKVKERWFFAGLIILAANNGGSCSPIGDVSLIMLWIGGQITPVNLILKTILPCIVSLLIPLTIISFKLKGDFERTDQPIITKPNEIPASMRDLIFFMGIGGLLFVPVFKTITSLPPFIGMLISLAIIWSSTEHLNRKYKLRESYSCARLLMQIDTPSILFFLGILLSVAGLQSMGFLNMFAKGLSNTFEGNIYVMNLCIGLVSAIIDNVPLFAGAIGMYPLDVFPANHDFWLFLSYCGGTGGNMLIIGSAAGVAVMGIEKVEFLWYLKKITPWALIGFFSGAGVFILLNMFVY